MAGESNPAYEEYIEIGARDLAGDAILFGLRMNDGVNLEELALRFDIPPECLGSVRTFFGKLMTEGLMNESNGFFMLTQSGRMRCDAIATEIPEIEVQKL